MAKIPGTMKCAAYFPSLARFVRRADKDLVAFSCFADPFTAFKISERFVSSTIPAITISSRIQWT